MAFPGPNTNVPTARLPDWLWIHAHNVHWWCLIYSTVESVFLRLRMLVELCISLGPVRMFRRLNHSTVC